MTGAARGSYAARCIMERIPESHPRAESLRIRQRLVRGFERGLVATEGLLAHGRGEAFDYLLGEKSGRAARRSANAAAALLLLAERPVISVNGNAAALCPDELVRLAGLAGAELEVNLFYSGRNRKQKIARALAACGAGRVLGTDRGSSARLAGTDSARRTVDRNGILAADVVLVPLEDGDRTLALKRAGKKVVAIDLNPMSRTAAAADITIVDSLDRAMHLLSGYCDRLSGRGAASLRRTLGSFDNGKNLSESVLEIRDHLTGRSRIA